jgi:hypothetical protein
LRNLSRLKGQRNMESKTDKAIASLEKNLVVLNEHSLYLSHCVEMMAMVINGLVSIVCPNDEKIKPVDLH